MNSQQSQFAERRTKAAIILGRYSNAGAEDSTLNAELSMLAILGEDQ